MVAHMYIPLYYSSRSLQDTEQNRHKADFLGLIYTQYRSIALGINTILEKTKNNLFFSPHPEGFETPQRNDSRVNPTLGQMPWQQNHWLHKQYIKR